MARLPDDGCDDGHLEQRTWVLNWLPNVGRFLETRPDGEQSRIVFDE